MPDRHGNPYTSKAGKRYERYIGSKVWAKKRLTYWRTYGRSCKAVGCDATVDLHVHHHTYERLENEQMSDLVGLCKRHHDEVHDLYDEKRGALSLTRATELATGLDLSQVRVSPSHPLAGTTMTEQVKKERARRVKRKSPAQAKVKKVRRQEKTVAELELLHARTGPKRKCHCRSCEDRREPNFGAQPGVFDSRYTSANRTALALVGKSGIFKFDSGVCVCGQQKLRYGDRVVVVRVKFRNNAMKLQKVGCSTCR